MPSFEHTRSVPSRRIPQQGQRLTPNPSLHKKSRNPSFVGGVEILFAEIDAIFGNKKKHSSKSRSNLYLQKSYFPILADNLYDELDRWFLRMHATFESARDILIETYKINKRKILNFFLRKKVIFDQDVKVFPNDNIQALTEEIEEIFGGRLKRFGARVNLHKVVSQKSTVSANDLRNELERLLKKDKSQLTIKEVA